MSRRTLSLVLQTAVTALLLAQVFRRFDWQSFRATFERLPPWFYLASLGIVVGGQLLYAWRWKVVLGAMGMRLPYGEVLRQYLIGLFFGNLMPTAVGGDAAKVYYLGRHEGFVQVGASVLVDRFLGFFWLATIGAVLAWSTGARSPLFVLNRNLLTFFSAAFFVVLVAVRLAPVERLLLRRSTGGRAAPAMARASEFLRFVREGGCRTAPLAAAGMVVLAFVTALTGVYAIYFASVSGQAPPFVEVMNVLVSMSIFINVPISVNGIGLREQLHYMLFAALGQSKEVSVSIALVVFSQMLLLSLVGYGVWLHSRQAAPRAAI
ncbi:MAG TPA: lysylphosphatidylglycerol synthase transmembrane domain-containing protein [Vicinamibacterales bacterium]|jgi:hypothetical protein|nr:lysylphosphatidylglycerol synthase transmembrane domain-containing protein [Vicinamibacterales bacterium]